MNDKVKIVRFPRNNITSYTIKKPKKKMYFIGIITVILVVGILMWQYDKNNQEQLQSINLVEEILSERYNAINTCETYQEVWKDTIEYDLDNFNNSIKKQYDNFYMLARFR